MDTAVMLFRWLMILSLVTAVSAAPGSYARVRLDRPKLWSIVSGVLLVLSVLAIVWLVGNKGAFTGADGSLSGEYSRAMIFGTLSGLCAGLGLGFAKKPARRDE